MKFLVCLVLCFAAAQAGYIGLPGAVSYATPYATPYAYSAGVAPVASVYGSQVAYAGYPTAYSTVGAPLVRAAYAPSVYAAPSVYTTLLKK